MNDIMMDLETLDVTPSALVVSIGAVRFGPDGLGETFYRVLEMDGQPAHGRTISPDTVKWWLRQDVLAKAVFDHPTHLVVAALGDFAGFVIPDSGSRMWGNGASFDNVILASLYASYGFRAPWHFTDDRCFRTLKNLVPLEPGEGVQFRGTPHNALDDAIYQAEMAIAYMKKANLTWR